MPVPSISLTVPFHTARFHLTFDTTIFSINPLTACLDPGGPSIFAEGDFRTGLVLRLFWWLPVYDFKRSEMAMRGMVSRFGANVQVTQDVPYLLLTARAWRGLG